MSVPTGLPFEYTTRARMTEGLSGPELARALEERDRQLEDYLASLAASLAASRARAGAFSGTTNATTSALVVTHNLSMPTPYAVTIQPISPNGSSQTNRWTGWNVTAATSDTFTIGRCISQDGSLLAETAVTGRFIALPY